MAKVQNYTIVCIAGSQEMCGHMLASSHVEGHMMTVLVHVRAHLSGSQSHGTDRLKPAECAGRGH